MRWSARQAAAFAALVVAGAASLATSQAPPGQHLDKSDVVAFAEGQQQVERHVGMTLGTGDVPLDTGAEINISTRPVNGEGAVSVTIVRDSDGHVFHRDQRDPEPGERRALGGYFKPFGICPARTTCEDSFTVTFTRVPEDDRPELEFEWSLDVWATTDWGASATTPPEDSSLDVVIWR